jgi:hypothetical protein
VFLVGDGNGTTTACRCCSGCADDDGGGRFASGDAFSEGVLLLPRPAAASPWPAAPVACSPSPRALDSPVRARQPSPPLPCPAPRPSLPPPAAPAPAPPAPPSAAAPLPAGSASLPSPPLPPRAPVRGPIRSLCVAPPQQQPPLLTGSRSVTPCLLLLLLLLAPSVWFPQPHLHPRHSGRWPRCAGHRCRLLPPRTTTTLVLHPRIPAKDSGRWAVWGCVLQRALRRRQGRLLLQSPRRSAWAPGRSVASSAVTASATVAGPATSSASHCVDACTCGTHSCCTATVAIGGASRISPSPPCRRWDAAGSDRRSETRGASG